MGTWHAELVSERDRDHVVEGHPLGIGQVTDDVADGFRDTDVEVIAGSEGWSPSCSLRSRHALTVLP